MKTFIMGEVVDMIHSNFPLCPLALVLHISIFQTHLNLRLSGCECNTQWVCLCLVVCVFFFLTRGAPQICPIFN